MIVQSFAPDILPNATNNASPAMLCPYCTLWEHMLCAARPYASSAPMSSFRHAVPVHVEVSTVKVFSITSWDRPSTRPGWSARKALVVAATALIVALIVLMVLALMLVVYVGVYLRRSLCLVGKGYFTRSSLLGDPRPKWLRQAGVAQGLCLTRNSRSHTREMCARGAIVAGAAGHRGTGSRLQSCALASSLL